MNRKSSSGRVPHCTRPDQRGLFHATLHLCDGLPNMRTDPTWDVLTKAMRAGRERFGFRLAHFSVLSNHLHLIVESYDDRSLSRGMQGLSIRIAKALNKLWCRKGKVFADRFFARALSTMTEIRYALRYVFQNARKHGIPIPRGQVDPFSSARWFRFWREVKAENDPDPPIAETRHPTLYMGQCLALRG